ncbi:MAG TPA: hypothetical protein VKF40_23880 [Burkholderiales bacterium]|nr:hypothetical protein [Burkholderiales bacterium]
MSIMHLRFVLVAMCLAGVPFQAEATAIAHGDLDFKNLAITTGTGTTFSLDGPWTLEAFAHADNSLGQVDDQFNTDISPSTIGASAAVTWASAAGAASAPNDPPDLAITGAASSDVNVPGCGPAAAFSNGRGTLFNSFTLTSSGPSAAVTFAIDISGVLKTVTDLCGIVAASEVIFSLEVDGTPVLFHDDLLSIGPSDAATKSIATHLTNTVTLDTGVSHFLLLEADSESRGQVVVREPPAGVLLVAGLAALAAARRRTVRLGTK